MIEPFSKSLILSTIATGDSITKNTSMSIALVITIVAATMYITNAMADTRNDISNLKDDVQELKDGQKEFMANIREIVGEEVQSYQFEVIK